MHAYVPLPPTVGRAARRLALGAAAAALAASGLVAAAPAAHAADPIFCSSGYACVYNSDSSGARAGVIYRNAGDTGSLGWSVRVGANGGYVWNNGYAYPGADHIELTTSLGPGRFGRQVCLHYGPFADDTHAQHPTALKLQANEYVTNWYWRGECTGNEDVWKVINIH